MKPIRLLNPDAAEGTPPAHPQQQPSQPGREPRAAKTNPDATPGTPPDAPDPEHGRGAAAKAVGGGLEPGTTDFGPSTEGMAGGTGGFGSGTARTTGTPPQAAEGMYAAGGNSTLNTGRSTQPDTRTAAGGAAPQSPSVPGSRSSQTTEDPNATAPNLIPGTTRAAENENIVPDDPRQALRKQMEEARKQMNQPPEK